MTALSKESSSPRVYGYLPDDNPPLGARLSLGFQQFLTIFPATVLVTVLGFFLNAIFLIFKTPRRAWHVTGPINKVIQCGVERADFVRSPRIQEQ